MRKRSKRWKEDMRRNKKAGVNGDAHAARNGST